MSGYGNMQIAVLDQLELIAKGKPSAGTEVSAEEMREIESRSLSWYRAVDVMRGLQVLGVFGIADAQLFYCRSIEA